MNLRTPLSRAKGLGSAKEGVEHWWAQRVTAVVLVPLALWTVFSVTTLVGAGYVEVQAWLGSPVNATLLLLFLIAMFHHMHLGLQVVIEDYVPAEAVKLASLIAMRFAVLFLAVWSVVSVLRIALRG